MLTRNLLSLGRSGAVPRPGSFKKHPGCFVSALSPLWDDFKQPTESSGASMWWGALLWIQALQGACCRSVDGQ